MKNIKNYLLMFILGGIIFSGISVYATFKAQADEIEYKNGVSVKDKIDDLYSFKNNLNFDNILSGSAYGNERGLQNIVSNELDKGNYLCFYDFVLITTAQSNSHGTSTYQPVINGCDSLSVKSAVFDYVSGKTTAYYGDLRTVVFTCNINNDDTTISIIYRGTVNEGTPWIGNINCVKIN